MAIPSPPDQTRGPKKTKRVGPAGGSPVGGYSRAGLWIAGMRIVCVGGLARSPRRLLAPRKLSHRPAAPFRAFRPSPALAPQRRGGGERSENKIGRPHEGYSNPRGRKMGAEKFHRCEPEASSCPKFFCQMAWRDRGPLTKPAGRKKRKEWVRPAAVLRAAIAAPGSLPPASEN